MLSLLLDVPLRSFLGSRQAVHLVVDPVLFRYFLVGNKEDHTSSYFCAVPPSIVVIIAGMIWDICIYQRRQDPSWQLAKKLYNVESALQEIDERWEMKPLTQVTPFC